MNILVIGNGFDLAHNLPTKYSDFLDFVKAYNNPEGDALSVFINNLKENNASVYSEICELIDNNVLLEYFLGIYEQKCANGKDGWIDFESEISSIIQNLDKATQDISGKINWAHKNAILDNNIFLALRPILRDDDGKVLHSNNIPFDNNLLHAQMEKVLNSLNRVIRLLEIYLYEYVEKIDCELVLPDILDIPIGYVLSFNYTDTHSRIYGKRDDMVKYCYFHGNVQENSCEQDCNLVLGIDEYLPKDRRDTDNQFLWFKKFYQRIYKHTDSSCFDWIERVEHINTMTQRSNPEPINLCIYGHSLDVTDKDILNRLILTKNTKTYIYYHNKEALAKQIGNLVKIIGEENLIKMTSGSNCSIHFMKAKPPIKKMT